MTLGTWRARRSCVVSGRPRRAGRMLEQRERRRGERVEGRRIGWCTLQEFWGDPLLWMDGWIYLPGGTTE